MRYPKVDGAEGRKYDRVYVVPLEVDNEKYPVDLDGRRPNLGKRHSHRGKSKVGIRLSSCAWGSEISQEVLLQSLIHQTETPGQFLTASSAWCRLSRFPSDLSFFNLLFYQRPPLHSVPLYYRISCTDCTVMSLFRTNAPFYIQQQKSIGDLTSQSIATIAYPSSSETVANNLPGSYLNLSLTYLLKHNLRSNLPPWSHISVCSVWIAKFFYCKLFIFGLYSKMNRPGLCGFFNHSKSLKHVWIWYPKKKSWPGNYLK